MLRIKESKTADTRSCDYRTVDKATLLASSVQHIGDVRAALEFFRRMLSAAAQKHDWDKLEGIDHFHSDFATGFKETGWWDNHRKVNRHHLLQADGIPADVNLIDVLEFIADCVMAGKARGGEMYALKVDPELMMRAFTNTADLLSGQIVVEKE